MLIGLVKMNKSSFSIKEKKYDLSSFSIFVRKQISAFIDYSCKNICPAVETTKLTIITENIENQKGYFFCKLNLNDKKEIDEDGEIVLNTNSVLLIAIILTKTEDEISRSAVLQLLNEMKYPKIDLSQLLVKYKNINDHDTLSKASKELNMTESVLQETLEKVLDRGKKIEEINQQASIMEKKTAELFKKAKKQNTCCFFF